MIYFAQMGETLHVKIGWSTLPERRIARLQTGLPQKLTVLRLIDGPRWGEKWLHNQYAKRRISGEWFHFDDGMLSVTLPAEKPIRASAPPPKPQNHPQTKRWGVRLAVSDPVKIQIKVAAYSKGMDVGDWLLGAAMAALAAEE